MKEARKVGDMTVNDGKGLYDNQGMCDVLLESINYLPKLLIDNQFIAFCKTIADIGAIIRNLKKGIANDLKSKDKNIEMLKKTREELGVAVETIPIEKIKDGVNDGSN